MYPTKDVVLGIVVNIAVVFISFALPSIAFINIFGNAIILLGIISGVIAGLLISHFAKKIGSWKRGGLTGTLSIFFLNISAVLILLSDYLPIGLDVNSLPTTVSALLLILTLTLIWIIPAFIIGALIGNFWKDNKTKRRRR